MVCFMLADGCTDTPRTAEITSHSSEAAASFREWILYTVCGLEILVTTEKNISRLFFFEVYLVFDKQNDCHSNMCILLNKYLLKYHRQGCN